jgi:anti-sigma factor RsiW
VNTPPFLLGAAILFWGWLGGHAVVAIALAAVFEAARFIGWRVSLTEAQQMRVTDGSTLLALAAGVMF